MNISTNSMYFYQKESFNRLEDFKKFIITSKVTYSEFEGRLFVNCGLSIPEEEVCKKFDELKQSFSTNLSSRSTINKIKKIKKMLEDKINIRRLCEIQEEAPQEEAPKESMASKKTESRENGKLENEAFKTEGNIEEDTKLKKEEPRKIKARKKVISLEVQPRQKLSKLRLDREMLRQEKAKLMESFEIFNILPENEITPNPRRELWKDSEKLANLVISNPKALEIFGEFCEKWKNGLPTNLNADVIREVWTNVIKGLEPKVKEEIISNEKDIKNKTALKSILKARSIITTTFLMFTEKNSLDYFKNKLYLLRHEFKYARGRIKPEDDIKKLKANLIQKKIASLKLRNMQFIKENAVMKTYIKLCHQLGVNSFLSPIKAELILIPDDPSDTFVFSLFRSDLNLTGIDIEAEPESFLAEHESFLNEITPYNESLSHMFSGNSKEKIDMVEKMKKVKTLQENIKITKEKYSKLINLIVEICAIYEELTERHHELLEGISESDYGYCMQALNCRMTGIYD